MHDSKRWARLALGALAAGALLLACGDPEQRPAEPTTQPKAPVWDLMQLVRSDPDGPAALTVSRQNVWREVRKAVASRLPAAIEHPVEIPPDGLLDLGYTVAPPPAGFDAVSPVRFRVVFTDETGGAHPLLERVVDLRTREGHRRWFDARIDLGPWAGRKGTLAFRADPEAPGSAAPPGLALFAAPRILQPARADAPSVLLVTIDCLRADHVHAYGYARETTPSLDRLAAEGVRFAHAYSNAPMTLPSMAQLFTSKLFPTASDPYWLAPFVARGVPSTAIINNLYLALWQTVGHDPELNDRFDRLLFEDERDARAITDAAIATLDRQRGTRFVLHLHYLDAHTPYKLIPPAADVFGDPAYRGRVTQLFADVDAHAEDYSPADRRRVVDWYDAGVRWVDQNLGRLIEHLREDGRLDQTVVVVTADHGEELWDHGRFFHGRTLYDELLHVPLIVRLPGGAHAGTVVERAVSAIDVAPGILEWARLPAPPSFTGRSLAQVLAHPEQPADVVVATATGSMFPTRYALRTPRAKLIEDVMSGERRLFALADDPRERQDVIAQQPALAAELAEELAEARGVLWRSGYQLRIVGSGSPYRLGLESVSERSSFATLDRAGPAEPQLELSLDARGLSASGVADGEPLALRFDRERLDAGRDDVTFRLDPADRIEIRLGADARVLAGSEVDLRDAALEAREEPPCAAPATGVRVCLWRWPGVGVAATPTAPDEETRARLRALGYAQ